ncbi:hypothetical protein JCM9534A_33610 [Catenuloplanes indicus JCM 9534]
MAAAAEPMLDPLGDRAGPGPELDHQRVAVLRYRCGHLAADRGGRGGRCADPGRIAEEALNEGPGGGAGLHPATLPQSPLEDQSKE